MKTPPAGMVANSGDGSLQCPRGKNCRLRLVSAEKMFAECDGEEGRKCPQALAFGGAFFCFLPLGGPAQPLARSKRA